MFESLHSFLPQFVQSCEEVQREIAETGTTKYAVEELISDDDSDDDSTSTSDSDSDSDESGMSEEEEEKEEVPSIEMVKMRICSVIYSELPLLLWKQWK